MLPEYAPLRQAPSLQWRQFEPSNCLHRKKQVILIVAERDETVLEVESAGQIVNGVDFDGANSHVLRDVGHPAQAVDEEVFA